jgi:hypothetical protein
METSHILSQSGEAFHALNHPDERFQGNSTYASERQSMVDTVDAPSQAITTHNEGVMRRS